MKKSRKYKKDLWWRDFDPGEKKMTAASVLRKVHTKSCGRKARYSKVESSLWEYLRKIRLARIANVKCSMQRNGFANERKGYSFKTISNHKRSFGQLFCHLRMTIGQENPWLSYHQYSYWGWHRAEKFLFHLIKKKACFPLWKAIRSITSIMTSLSFCLNRASYLRVVRTDGQRYWFGERTINVDFIDSILR